MWDGGHRIPFVVRWPGMVKPGSTSNQLICLIDLMATCADILKLPLPDDGAEDSVSFLPAFKNEAIVSSRKGVIHHSVSGHFAYRQDKWKLLLARGSGGWTAPNESASAKAGALVAQLYNLEADPSETTNLYESHPKVVSRLLKQLESDIARGRATDGPNAENDAKIKLWKSEEK